MTGNDTACYTVSQVAELTGATAAQLKNWDKTGLLVAQRTGDGIANNRKLYTRGDIDAVREILLYRSLGFSLDEIKLMLAATPEERGRLVAERTSALKSEFSNIQKQIELTSALEVFTPEALLSELDCDDARAASDEYGKDENLRMMVRWMRSHTQQDSDRLKQELAEALEDFEALDPDAAWEEVELRLLRFCDVWSSAFGWPTVGQMLSFALIFQDFADEGADGSQSDEAPLVRTRLTRQQIEMSGIADLFDARTSEELSSIFLLAWADNALRVMDDALVACYLSEDGPESIGSAAVLGAVLCSLVSELGCQPHLYKCEMPPAHPQELCALSDGIFALLEGIILDAEVGRYLDIETLFAIDQQSMDSARELVAAFADDRLEAWYLEEGAAELRELCEQWVDTLAELWRLEHQDEAATMTDYADEDAVWAWIEDRYARVLEDPPEPTWATEEESMAFEKKMRALVQSAESQASEVDE